MNSVASSTSFAHQSNAIFSSLSFPSNHHHCQRVTFLASSISYGKGRKTIGKLGRQRVISCEIALKPDSATVDASSPSSSSASVASASSAAAEEEESSLAKIGARVRVKVPLKVYHIPKVPEFDLTGMEGELKQYVGLWKGNRISANLPFKVEFVTKIEGRGTVKFFAHLKEDEFEYVDGNDD
ncbi:PREDICTED: ferredoxin-thioredoxin reductase, variable chain-like [Nelumbo nucifera]|uniref:Ferredoxin-thioredoxin reductase, variable chain-like n=2 Tax=Nelumbo nucifera TaxID=4432 RepID=A0A1U8BGW4_NELNU|nr:PREDICTED: ferredoxin-thioredoxin reductase, variable chain-like [Nelumbo nucifera]DAD43884.1 TPA_asm: hypothetical protein HUJ06_002114 [Nelumbo nucifera]